MKERFPCTLQRGVPGDAHVSRERMTVVLVGGVFAMAGCTAVLGIDGNYVPVHPLGTGGESAGNGGQGGSAGGREPVDGSSSAGAEAGPTTGGGGSGTAGTSSEAGGVSGGGGSGGGAGGTVDSGTGTGGASSGCNPAACLPCDPIQGLLAQACCTANDRCGCTVLGIFPCT